MYELDRSVKRTETKFVPINLSPEQLDRLKMSKKAKSRMTHIYVDVENIFDESVRHVVWRSGPVELVQKKNEYARIGLESDLEPKEIRIYVSGKSLVCWKLKVEKIGVKVAKRVYEKWLEMWRREWE
jgi:hypothetical protein